MGEFGNFFLLQKNFFFSLKRKINLGEENSKMNLNLEIKYFLVIKKITFSICDYSRPKLKFTLSQNTGENFIFQAGHF